MMLSAVVESPETAIAPPVRMSLFDIPGTHWTEVSLEIEPGMKFEHWERMLRLLERAEQGIQWYIGDALQYGEREYGEKYAQCLDAHAKTGIPVDTLRSYQWVAENVKPVTRVTTLDWSVHREVASLPEEKQKEILQQGAAQKASGKKYTRRHAERDAAKAKREGKPKPDETAYIHPSAIRSYFDRCIAALAELESDAVGSETRMLNHAQQGQLKWQRDRTIETDCEAIVEVFDTFGAYNISRNDLFLWLTKCTYFISETDLDARCETMIENDMLEIVDREESRQEGRKGGMDEVYALTSGFIKRRDDED